MFELITTERLDRYKEQVKELNALLERKEKIKAKLGLRGVDYSKDKITHGNKQPLTEEEEYTNKLLKINAEIKKIEPVVFREHQILKTQISRLSKRRYREVLIYRYIEGWKWSQIKKEFFEMEEDYEEQKDEKYHRKVMYWHSRALEELQKVSSKPFIKCEQLVFEV